MVANEVENLVALGGVAFPAVVGEAVELLDRDLVDDEFEFSLGIKQGGLKDEFLKAAEQRAGGVAEGLEASGGRRRTDIYRSAQQR